MNQNDPAIAVAFDVYYASLLSIHFHPGFQRDIPVEERMGDDEKIAKCAALAVKAIGVRQAVLTPVHQWGAPPPQQQLQENPVQQRQTQQEESQKQDNQNAEVSHDVSRFFDTQKGHAR